MTKETGNAKTEMRKSLTSYINREIQYVQTIEIIGRMIKNGQHEEEDVEWDTLWNATRT